jgi:hypothetical protein
VTSDIAAVRRALDACFHDALLFVDGVSPSPRSISAWTTGASTSP